MFGRIGVSRPTRGDPTRVLAGEDRSLETFAGFEGVHPDPETWEKLDSLVDGAELASNRLF